MDWSEFASRMLSKVQEIAFATSELGKKIPRRSAEAIREASRTLTALADSQGMLVGQTSVPLPPDEILHAWRSAIPGVVRCGDSVQPSAHELVLADASRMVNMLHGFLPEQDDAKPIALAEKILDGYLDRSRLSEINAALALEWSAAAIHNIKPDGDETDGPFGHNGYRWKGNRHYGLSPRAWKLLSFVWPSRDRSCSYHDAIDALYPDEDADALPKDPLGGHRKDANAFFAQKRIPLIVVISGSKRTGRVSICALVPKKPKSPKQAKKPARRP
jgi:hypothetical protein